LCWQRSKAERSGTSVFDISGLAMNQLFRVNLARKPFEISENLTED